MYPNVLSSLVYRTVKIVSNQALPLCGILFYLCCVFAKEGESLVHYDHVLDVVGCGYQLVVDFAHTPQPLMMAIIKMHYDSAVVYREGYHEQSAIPN